MLAATATGPSDIYSTLPNGRRLLQLTTYEGQDASATYSPDGHSIAWCTTRGNTHGGADVDPATYVVSLARSRDGDTPWSPACTTATWRSSTPSARGAWPPRAR